jgi:hypothetical protein
MENTIHLADSEKKNKKELAFILKYRYIPGRC